MAKFASGRFVPKNPQKYVGKSVKNIFFRSSWELHFLKWLDNTNAVLRYGSEELAIPYVSPLDGRVHKYYPDMIIMYLDNTGQVRKEIIEIKPYKESVATPKMTERDAKALMVNQAKWKYAADWATKNGAIFRVITEKTLYYSGNSINKRKKPLGSSV